MRFLLAIAVALPALAFAKSTARMPGPAPILRSFDPVAVNAQCEGCHSDIAKEWRSSLHRAAFTNDAFQHALARDPVPFCRGCHAPEANAWSPEAARAALGVGCVSCHVLDRAPLAVPGSRAAPHPLAREAVFASPAACAGCHEFEFPDRHRRVTPLLMQSTLSEHAKSPHAAKRCASCHMPIVSGHRSHAFVASRDAAAIRAAVRIDAVRAGDGVTITLTASDTLGHAFPTGDLFRRVTVETIVDGAKHVVHFARHFASREELKGHPVRVQIADDRVAPGAPRSVEVFGKTVRYRVLYERVAFLREPDAEVEGSIELAAGAL